MRALHVIWIAILLCGCGGADTRPADAGYDTAIAPEDTAVDAFEPLALYAPGATYQVTMSQDSVTYTDIFCTCGDGRVVVCDSAAPPDGCVPDSRTVNVAIYRPQGAPTPAPVVVLSHGGAKGKVSTENAMDKWAPQVAAAGYIAVAIAHPAREGDAYVRLCEHLGVPDSIVCTVKINWDRPNDVSRVLDWLEIKAEEEKLKGVMDLTRVAHFGHSAGAGCAMMLAGATRNYVCAQSFTADQGAIVPCDVADLVSKVEPRIKAVLAFSPQGPNNDGFMTESFGTVGIPVLIATGQGDGDAPGEPENRKQAFELMGASEDAAHRFMLFIDDPGAQHTFFEAEVKACQKVTTEERCDEMQTWLVASALAFLDHQLRGRVQALTWLTSGSVEELSRSTASLTRK